MSDYSNFLHRLNAYREKVGLTQVEMAKMFGVHQSHYGRYEAGSRVITFKSLQTFEKNGGDLFRLLTGCESAEGPVGDFLAVCKNDESRQKLLNLLIWSIEFGSWMDHREQDEAAGALRKCMRLAEMRDGTFSIWEGIRRLEGLTQMEMADRLQMEVKRYRRIEKEGAEPDVEVLCTLYDRFQYSPQIFFDLDKFYEDELNFYWCRLSESTKQFLDKIVNAAIDRIRVIEQ